MEARFSYRAFRESLDRSSQAPPELERLAHILAAATLIQGEDTVFEEYEPSRENILERLRALAAGDAFAHQSSLGAFLVASYAMELVPSGLSTFRHVPLNRDGLVKALVEGGLQPDRVPSLVGSMEPALNGDGERQELHPNQLAGLAERALLRDEHARSIARAAYSPRDTARLVAAAKLVGRVRDALSVLPSRLEPALVITATGLWEREVRGRLLEGRSGPPVLFELLDTELTLARGDEPSSADLSGDTDDLDEPEDDSDIAITVAGQDSVTTHAVGRRMLGLVGREVRLGLKLDEPSESAVRERLGQVVRAVTDGRTPAEQDAWSRRLAVIALMYSGQSDDALERARPEDREWAWVESRHVTGQAPEPSECRRRAADLVTELTGAYVVTQ